MKSVGRCWVPRALQVSLAPSYHVNLKPHWLQQLCPLLLPPAKRWERRTKHFHCTSSIARDVGKKNSLNEVLLKASFVQQHQNIETLRSNLSSCPWQWVPLQLIVRWWKSRHVFFESLKRHHLAFLRIFAKYAEGATCLLCLAPSHCKQRFERWASQLEHDQEATFLAVLWCSLYVCERELLMVDRSYTQFFIATWAHVRYLLLLGCRGSLSQ